MSEMTLWKVKITVNTKINEILFVVTKLLICSQCKAYL